MTDESRAKLLQAYKFAVEAEQDGIADLLEDVILDVMDGERTSSIVIEPRNTPEPQWREPPWRVTCTGIDTTTREVKS